LLPPGLPRWQPQQADHPHSGARDDRRRVPEDRAGGSDGVHARQRVRAARLRDGRAHDRRHHVERAGGVRLARSRGPLPLLVDARILRPRPRPRRRTGPGGVRRLPYAARHARQAMVRIGGGAEPDRAIVAPGDRAAGHALQRRYAGGAPVAHRAPRFGARAGSRGRVGLEPDRAALLVRRRRPGFARGRAADAGRADAGRCAPGTGLERDVATGARGALTARAARDRLRSGRIPAVRPLVRRDVDPGRAAAQQPAPGVRRAAGIHRQRRPLPARAAAGVRPAADGGGIAAARALTLTLALAAAVACAPASATPRQHWVGTWTAAQQLVEPRNMPPAPGLSGSTLRQVIHASVGGSTLRVRLANTFGDGPLAVTAAHVARSLGGSAIEVASDRALTFAGADSVRIAPGAVVALGNSITDGRGSGTNRNDRWPDNLARRLQADARTRHVAVLNAGIGGNTVLTGGLGPTALARLDRDVLAQQGVRWVMLLEGVNDIGGARDSGSAAAVARNLPLAYREISDRVHARGLRIYGATITPFGGSHYDGVD